MEKQNLFDCPAVMRDLECFDALLETDQLRLERIVSCQHATPPGEWYDQDRSEWVVLLKGAAGLRLEGREDALVLTPGDYVCIPAHLRHRVDWTDSGGETVWLALHYQG